ncbi:UNVERIFIED_CONTAM: hypothetical protein FKN15_047690 [Acipenser sinensis]
MGGSQDLNLQAVLYQLVEEEVDVKHSDDEDFRPSVFSRRKLVSNWDRYEAAEKEEVGESGQSQRGADFSVLLSSADLLTPHVPHGRSWRSENANLLTVPTFV